MDRVDFEDGELDEIVSTKGAHLENLGDDQWFLIFYHADGTQTALWFESADLNKPNWETRRPPISQESGETG